MRKMSNKITGVLFAFDVFPDTSSSKAASRQYANAKMYMYAIKSKLKAYKQWNNLQNDKIYGHFQLSNYRAIR